MLETQLVDVHRQLFSDSFLVYMPYSATVSRAELMDYGVVGIHNKASLERYLNDPILVKATIVQIATTMANGDTVTLANSKDAVIIYDLVIQHLENWLTIGYEHLASRLPPLGDLMMLDDLAKSLYPHLKVGPTPKTTLIDYALGDDLLLGMMGGTAYEPLDAYKTYTPLFIEIGTPEH